MAVPRRKAGVAFTVIVAHGITMVKKKIVMASLVLLLLSNVLMVVRSGWGILQGLSVLLCLVAIVAEVLDGRKG